MRHRIDEFGDVDANRQLRRRLAQWIGWPLSILAAIAIGAAWLHHDPSPASAHPAPTVTTTLSRSGVATAPPAAPRSTAKPAPATAGVAAPHPTQPTSAHKAQLPVHYTTRPTPAPTTTPTATPAPSTPAPTASHEPPVCLHLMLKICL